jgi:hypothetical protein
MRVACILGVRSHYQRVMCSAILPGSLVAVLTRWRTHEETVAPLAQLRSAGRKRLLGALNAPIDKVMLWTGALNRAEGTAGDPLPCPDCFLKGRTSRLIPMSNPAPGVAAVVCAECNEQIEYPDI